MAHRTGSLTPLLVPLLALPTWLALPACDAHDAKRSRLAGSNLGGLLEPELALAAAETVVPDGVAIEAELEIEDGEGAPIWEFEFYSPGIDELTQVESDAVTGELLKIVVKDGKRKKRARLADANVGDLLGLQVALASARKAAKGLPIEVELELDGDDATYEVEVYAAGSDSFLEVELDARTGEVLEVEVEDD